MNITDYVEKFGNEMLSADNITNSDILVLTALSYINFPQVKENFYDKTKLCDAIDQVYVHTLSKQEEKFITKLSESKRYSNLNILGYRKEMGNLEVPAQFSVLTIQISEDLHFISYRGTDSTIVGWKEDFQFAYMNCTPSQKKAVEYLEEAATKLKGKFIVSGHSKGGNLAAYASIFAHKSTQDKIKHIFCNDAPGFNKRLNIFLQKGYYNIVGKIHCILPQDSIIGRLLQTFPPNHCNYHTIYSVSESVIYQHDIYNWQINDYGNLRLTEPKVATKIFMEKINGMLDNSLLNKGITEIIFGLLDKNNIKSIDDLEKALPISILPKQ